MQFTDLRIPIATRMQLVISGPDYKPQPFSAQLLGFRSANSVLAFFPKKPLISPHPHSNVVARVGLQSAIVRFDSTVLQFHEQPFAYLHLAYPTEITIEQQLRLSPRFDLDIPIKVAIKDTNNSSSEVAQGEFLDLSLNGARMACPSEIAAVGSPLLLSADVLVAGTQQQLQLTAQVKSVSTPKDRNSLEPFIFGLIFVDAALQEQLLLQALCYELQSDKLNFEVPPN